MRKTVHKNDERMLDHLANMCNMTWASPKVQRLSAQHERVLKLTEDLEDCLKKEEIAVDRQDTKRLLKEAEARLSALRQEINNALNA